MLYCCYIDLSNDQLKPFERSNAFSLYIYDSIYSIWMSCCKLQLSDYSTVEKDKCRTAQGICKQFIKDGTNSNGLQTHFRVFALN